ncbi:MAG: hypothetical protein ABSH32_25545 [Bryobacteraceae bacterium]
MTASEAAAAFLTHADPMGLEVVSPEEDHPQGNHTRVPLSTDNRVAILSGRERQEAILPL